MSLKEELAVPIENAVEELNLLLDKFEWFHNAMVVGENIVVYVDVMNNDVFHYVPMHCYGHDVKIHYTAYYECEEKFCKPIVFDSLN